MGQGVEKRIYTAWEASEYQQTAAISIQSYGPEILGFLVAFTNNPSDADDVFSYFLEDFWRGLPGFEWQCSLRAWAYTLARHAARRFASRSLGKKKRHLPLSRAPLLADAAEEVRSSTALYLRTETKSRMRELREQLPEHDQLLLVLRIDKELSWRDIAMVISEDGKSSDREELDKRVPLLRKQFERAKNKLKRLAVEEGLIGTD